ncbi:MAG TPA: alpha/beta hydrolase [Candidatus Acidoferrales bacterium]|jgi:pimeloyl-ACP methyl ester carboxylesterase|nr:alpha/beta hydrolase [Candidatus Acidoferrales bacterium]
MKNSNSNKPSIVLVHGAFSDGSSWKKIIPILEEDGITVTAVQNPLRSLAEDVATTRRVIDAQKGDVILVGHSYGGSVITDAAAGSDKVKALVFVAAFAPDAGESVGGLLGKFPPAALGTALAPDSASFLYIDRTKFHHVFAEDVPEGEASIMAAAQKPIAASAFGEPTTSAAWKTTPSWYVVTTLDHAVNPELQRFMAKRIGAQTTEVKASHVPFFSQPEEIAKVIKAAAAQIRN